MTATLDDFQFAVAGSAGQGAVKGSDMRGVRREVDASCWPSLPARLLLLFIRLWRWTAPMRVPRCRFEPSCSVYAQESVRRYGAMRGGWRALRRIARCNPWNPGGVDPVD